MKTSEGINVAIVVNNSQSQKILEDHISYKHEGIKKYGCDKCDKQFTNGSYLKDHIARIHEKTAKLHKCTTCGKIFHFRANLRRHIGRIHDNIKNTQTS